MHFIHCWKKLTKAKFAEQMERGRPQRNLLEPDYMCSFLLTMIRVKIEQN